MAILQSADFANGKQARSGPYMGMTRHAIVEKRIKDGVDFSLGPKGKDGKAKGIKYNKNTMEFTYEILTGTNKGEVITEKITSRKANIFKDEEFGSTGGSGGGTLQTAIAESCQCVWLVACLKYPRKEYKELYTKKILKEAFDSDKCQVGSTTFKQIMDLDPSWHESGYNSAKKIIADGYVKSGYTIHRDSSVMKSVYANKKTAFTNSDLPNMKDDKWNPGDIWATARTFNINQLDTTTIKAYNNSILELFNNKTLVGISLKKVVRGNAKIAVYNNTPKRPKGLKYKEGKLESASGNFFSSKFGTIFYTTEKGSPAKMEVRANKDFGTHKAEIILTTARGGGAGWTVLQEIIVDVLGTAKALPSNLEIQTRTNNILSGSTPAINKFWELAKAAGYTTKFKKKDFVEQLLKKDKFWIHAKYGALIMISRLEETTPAKANSIVNKINNYAGSQSDLSSVYIKVYE